MSRKYKGSKEIDRQITHMRNFLSCEKEVYSHPSFAVTGNITVAAPDQLMK